MRAPHLEEPRYMFCDYKRRRWARDAGLRIGHLLLSTDLAKRLSHEGVDCAVPGRRGASDHAPAWIAID